MLISNNNVLLDTISGSMRRTADHEAAKQTRNDRFARKIYGVVQQPIIPKDIIGIWEPPSYLQSRRTSRYIAATVEDHIDRKLDLRCFYTGIVCQPFKAGGYGSTDPKFSPWLGSRDHLIPMRRDVPNNPIDIGNYSSMLVWSGHMANTVFGLTPFLVKMKIRQWMMTIPYDRNDSSVESGHNIKWLIIKLLDDFRIKNRYPWSRKANGDWWYPEISIPFMNRMWQAEQNFLELNEQDRNDFIKNFAWQF